MINWIDLTDEAVWQDVVRRSHIHPVCIFKHSTRCGVSSMVLNRLEQHEPVQNSSWYMLDLIRYRTFSDLIAESTGVVHESPQMIILSDGAVQIHFSHTEIRTEVISQWLQQLQRKDPVL
ncbi:MAG TPA: bacillithiol system redox-active protein YtxJ [Chitinophagales bacterium]|nr:bacillithiol system redox-active protein YtxJ [Chitinophagales bacterium]HPE96421.1 bacillithiol system redox-active protein YtxJ [Chitinophagales bacterium]